MVEAQVSTVLLKGAHREMGVTEGKNTHVRKTGVVPILRQQYVSSVGLQNLGPSELYP